MSTILAYAVSVLLSMGVISSDDVNRTSSTLRVVEKDGKTVVIDPISSTEVIIW